jgi:hypothetical protein
MRRRKVTYPPPKTASSGASSSSNADERAAAAASRAVSINLDAKIGRSSVVPGGKVRITTGLYAGEIAVVESLITGVIPAALVRTEAGKTRRARTVDLIPVAD